MRLFRYFFLLFATLIPFLNFASPTNVNWSNPQQISNYSAYVPDAGKGSAVVVGSAQNGDAIIAWYDNNHNLFYVYFTALDQTLSSPQFVNGATGTAIKPQLIYFDSDNNATFVWVSTLGSDFVLESSTLLYGASSWTDLHTVTLCSASVTNCLFASSGDNNGNFALIAAIEATPSLTSIKAYTIAATGLGFVAENLASDVALTAPNCFISTATGGEYAVAMWASNATTLNVSSYLFNSGSLWTTLPAPPILANTTDIWMGTALAVNANQTIIATWGAITSVDPFRAPVGAVYTAGSWSIAVNMTPPDQVISEISCFAAAIDADNNGYLVLGVHGSLQGFTQYNASYPATNPSDVFDYAFGVQWDDSIPISTVQIAVNGIQSGLVFIYKNVSAFIPFDALEQPVDPADPYIMTSNYSGTSSYFAMSPASVAALAWLNPSSQVMFAYNGLLFVPSGPVSMTGEVIIDRFLYATDRVHALQWVASPTGGIASYSIFRNGIQIASVSAFGPLQYYDHQRSATTSDVYQVYAVNDFGAVSTTYTTITLQ